MNTSKLSTPLTADEPRWAPSDRSDDIAYDLFNCFFASPEEFNRLARHLSEQELLLRVETAQRLFYHIENCTQVQLARNAHLGFDEDEIASRFVTHARDRALNELGGLPFGVKEAFNDVIEASSRSNSDRLSSQIALFSNASQEAMLARIYALAGMVAAMRSALEL